jgi:hypothetical protein
MLSAIAVPLVIGCGAPPGSQSNTASPAPSTQASVEVLDLPVSRTIEVTCADPVVILEAGVERGSVCLADALARKLTILDLGDAWTPSLLAARSDGIAPRYRAQYLALAAERDASGRSLAGDEALGELYGVLPSLAIVRARLADDPRHFCHASIDSGSIARLAMPYALDHASLIKLANQRRVWLEAELERERARRELPDFAGFAAIPALANKYTWWKRLTDQHNGIVAAQKHYACEGFLSEAYTNGSMTWRTGNATELFQRRNFLMPNQRLDAETRKALVLDSREHDFRLALRILRERVVDATGIIEDGTASSGPQPILGRMLDPAHMRTVRGSEKPLPDGAPDLVSAITEAAARQLGWLGPAETRAFLAKYPGGVRVAVGLPPLPAYHSSHMDLVAEIDRGDVWYDERPIAHHVAHRPTLVLYVNDHGTKRPLLRWPTTIGGWADQRTESGRLLRRWKESDVGRRVWRDLYAAPTWLPPPTTPDRDLVTNLYNGHYALKDDVLGPGPHSAYGMTLLVHHQAVKRRDGTERFDDNGIGTHGSSSVTSIVNGTSHGCHRLYNQLAVRLSGFLLRHREHIVRGEQRANYRREVRHKGERFVANVTTRGFLYEMTPPVPINVLAGNIRSKRKVPPRNAAPARPD